MIPVLNGNILELPASKALRNLGLYYDQQLSSGVSAEVLAEHFSLNLNDVNIHVDSLREHGFGLAQQYNEQVRTVAVTAISTQVIFCGERSQLAHTPRGTPFVEDLALDRFFIGPLPLDNMQSEVVFSEPHFWYELRLLGGLGTSHFMNVTSTVLVMPGVFERVN